MSACNASAMESRQTWRAGQFPVAKTVPAAAASAKAAAPDSHSSLLLLLHGPRNKGFRSSCGSWVVQVGKFGLWQAEADHLQTSTLMEV